MELCTVHCTYNEYMTIIALINEYSTNSTNSGNKCYVNETVIVIFLNSCNYLSCTRQLLLGVSKHHR